MQYWARGTDEVKQPKHNTENYKKMSNTDLTNKLGVNPDVHEGKAVLVSYKTPAVSLIVKSDVHEGKAVLVFYKTPAVSLIVKFLFFIRHLPCHS